MIASLPVLIQEEVLMRAVSCSQLMVPLFSAYYFQHDWCRREMAIMLERERHMGLIGHNDNYGLDYPGSNSGTDSTSLT